MLIPNVCHHQFAQFSYRLRYFGTTRASKITENSIRVDYIGPNVCVKYQAIWSCGCLENVSVSRNGGVSRSGSTLYCLNVPSQNVRRSGTNKPGSRAGRTCSELEVVSRVEPALNSHVIDA